MSQKVRTWAIGHHADHFVEYPKHSKNAWSSKNAGGSLDSKYEYTCWIDVDCEVLTNIQDVLNYAFNSRQDRGSTEDWGKKVAIRTTKNLVGNAGSNLIKIILIF